MVDDLYDDLFAYITVFFCKKKCLRVAQLRKKNNRIITKYFFMVYLYTNEKKN